MPVSDDIENTFKILVATDIHLGFLEKDPIRGEDTFTTFKEILQIARNEDVDFILLGGDLFHDGRPSVNAMEKCTALLRHYCMGDRPINVKFLSDPAEVFSHCADPCVNYMDPNLNVAYPVFSIHGNHDDPLGYNAKCSLDMLSSAGLVNYFGRQFDLTELVLNPLLFSKGRTKLAIYGLGALKDKVLHRLLRNNKLQILRPEENKEDWFNVLVLHQNRTAHRSDEYVPVTFLPEFLNLVIWGHEHENRLKPEHIEERGFYVSQPGSSIATSLSEGEAKEKQVGILKIRDKRMSMKGISLKTVRPFIFKTIKLCDTAVADNLTIRVDIAVNKELEKEIEAMIVEATDLLTGHPKQPQLPLLRLRVEYDSSDQLINLIRFGMGFQDRVANPSDMVLMKSNIKRDRNPLGDIIDEEAFANAANTVNLNRVEDLVHQYFKDCAENSQLKVLSVGGLTDAVKTYVTKGDTQAIEDLLTYQSEKTTKYLLDRNVGFDDIETSLDELRATRNVEDESKEIEAMLSNDAERLRNRMAAGGSIINDDDDIMEINGTVSSTPRGRGSRSRARGGRGKGRGKAVDATGDGMDVDEEAISERPVRGRGSRGGRGPRGSRGKKAETTPSGKPLDVFVRVRSQHESTTTTKGRKMAFLDDTDSD